MKPENDLSLLRPIPVNARPPLEELCWYNGHPLSHYWRPLYNELLTLLNHELRLKPLGWSKGEPVYADSPLRTTPTTYAIEDGEGPALKEYSLLRPVPVGATPELYALCWNTGGSVQDYWLPLKEYLFAPPLRDALRLAPLCWLRETPVYPDSILRHKVLGFVSCASKLVGQPGSDIRAEWNRASIREGVGVWEVIAAEDVPPEGFCGAPAETDSVLEVYLDGERILCEALPPEQARTLAKFILGQAE